MNYTELVAEITSYTENRFQIDDMNTFIKQAEQRIYNTVQFPAIRKNTTGLTTSGNRYLTCPNDWLATFSLSVIDADGNYNYLLNKDVNFIRSSYPNTNDTGIPEYYAQFDQDSFILGPMPDSDYDVELHYYYYPESIVTAVNTWLGDNFDSALFYGALLEAYTFMKGEPDILAEYQKRYNEAMALLKQLGDGKNRKDAYRSGQTRMDVL
tara:strand:- start:11485 stop:12114 length:630 start_codon:yes stop_codon:yes gene_type:complete